MSNILHARDWTSNRNGGVARRLVADFIAFDAKEPYDFERQHIAAKDARARIAMRSKGFAAKDLAFAVNQIQQFAS